MDDARVPTSRGLSLMELQPGLIVDQFRITGSLGQGGMADVYAADDLTMPRRVALKVLPGLMARHPEAVARFQREVNAAASLDHYGIVQIIRTGQVTTLELPYFAMRLLPGGDLTSRIAKGVPVDRALGIVRELAGAFAHAHARGFVHRDVKPANILFNEQDHPVLTDFGIAKALDGTQFTEHGMVVGTPAYMSPEQAAGKPVDARADLYGLGVILYEMLTGSTPFQGGTFAVVNAHISTPPPPLPESLAYLQPLISSLLAKSPDSRPRDGNALIAGIDSVLPLVPTDETGRASPGVREADSTAPTVVAPGSAERSVNRPWKKLILGVGAVALVAGAASFFVLTPPDPEQEAPSTEFQAPPQPEPASPAEQEPLVPEPVAPVPAPSAEPKPAEPKPAPSASPSEPKPAEPNAANKAIAERAAVDAARAAADARKSADDASKSAADAEKAAAKATSARTTAADATAEAADAETDAADAETDAADARKSAAAARKSAIEAEAVAAKSAAAKTAAAAATTAAAEAETAAAEAEKSALNARKSADDSGKTATKKTLAEKAALEQATVDAESNAAAAERSAASAREFAAAAAKDSQAAPAARKPAADATEASDHAEQAAADARRAAGDARRALAEGEKAVAEKSAADAGQASARAAEAAVDAKKAAAAASKAANTFDPGGTGM